MGKDERITAQSQPSARATSLVAGDLAYRRRRLAENYVVRPGTHHKRPCCHGRPTLQGRDGLGGGGTHCWSGVMVGAIR
jgi:hypothetical protein